MYPPPPEPRFYAVAILDLLGYKAHLWDDTTGTQKPEALASLYETCTLWMLATDYGRTFSGTTLASDGRLVPINEMVDYVVASDTMMLWAPMAKAQYLIWAAARVFLRALGWGAPLRGAVACGDCILDFEHHIAVGFPIVEAVEAEKRQEWLGISVLPSAADALRGTTGIVPYDVPVKAASTLPPLRHAIAWHWAEEEPNAGEIYLTRLAGVAPSSMREKYQNALDFIRAIGPAPAV